MKCLIKHPRLMIYSLSAFLFSVFFCAFGISSDSFATSVNCSATDYSTSSNVTLSYSNYCSSWDFDGSSPLYFYNLSFSVSNQTANSQSNVIFSFFGLSTSVYSNFNLGSLSYGNSSSYSFSNVFYSVPYNPNSGYYSIGFRPSRYLVWSFSFDVTDNFSDTYSVEPCPVCPEIPENPYDNKLDDIKKAIYCCGAVLIMLYFFFCIYKIIVKDGGSR